MRFEVFKRDSFTCQYCGSTPPKVILECDHITPVSKGGLNRMTNLLTACFDCNRGKSNKELTDLPESMNTKADELKEKRDQMKAYNRLLRSFEKEEMEQRKMVARAYEECFEGYTLRDHFLNGSVKKFIEALGVTDVVDNMYAAGSRINCSSAAVKYFCGICWTQIREKREQS